MDRLNSAIANTLKRVAVSGSTLYYAVTLGTVQYTALSFSGLVDNGAGIFAARRACNDFRLVDTLWRRYPTFDIMRLASLRGAVLPGVHASPSSPTETFDKHDLLALAAVLAAPPFTLTTPDAGVDSSSAAVAEPPLPACHTDSSSAAVAEPPLAACHTDSSSAAVAEPPLAACHTDSSSAAVAEPTLPACHTDSSSAAVAEPALAACHTDSSSTAVAEPALPACHTDPSRPLGDDPVFDRLFEASVAVVFGRLCACMRSQTASSNAASATALPRGNGGRG
jgi:hypothetical protein